MTGDLRGMGARERLERLAEALDSLEVEGSIQAQVLEELVTGPKTIAELAAMLYGVRRGEEGFSSSYMRVRRAAKRLESKGYISAPVLGREKPYRLTRLGAHAIAGILSNPPLPETSIVRAAIFAATLVLGAVTISSGALSPSSKAILSSLFLILLGMSIMAGLSWASEVL